MGDSPSTVRGLNLEGEEDLMPHFGLQTDGRIPLAQRRAAPTPAALNTASASALATTPTMGGGVTSPKLPPVTPNTPSTFRRRTSLAEPESPAFLPLSPRTPAVHPLSPKTDASIHLQQARASVVQVATGVQDGGRRGSLFGSSSSGGGGAGAASSAAGGGKRGSITSSHPPPAPSSTFRLNLGNGVTSSQPVNGLPPLAATPPAASDHLMNMSPSDTRRPSFITTTISTAKTLAGPQSKSSRRFLVFFPSRRMQKTFRLWFAAAVALFTFIKLVDFFLPATTSSMMGNLRSSSASAAEWREQLHIPTLVDQLPASFTEWMERFPRPSDWAQQPPLPAPPAADVQKPFRVQLGDAGPDEGWLVEAETARLPFEKAWDERMTALSEEEQQERAKKELVLSPLELADMRRNRRERLWAPPEEDLWVDIAQPAKGHLHESTVIFLHGLGERAADSFLAVHLNKRFPNTRWVLPQAPKQLVTALSASHPAWFDIDSFPYNPYTDRDPDGLFASVRALNRVIAEERALLIRNLRRRGGAVSTGPDVGQGYAVSVGPDGKEGDPAWSEGEGFGTPAEREWASKRIVTSGFSQGSVVALLSALTYPERLGGLVMFSGFLPIREDLSKLVVDLDRKDLPIFWGHGQNDPYLLFTDALTSISLLSPPIVPVFPSSPLAVPSSLWTDHPSYRLNFTAVTFESYVGLEHSFAWDELQDVAAFLEGVLPKGAQRGERIPRDLGVVANVAAAAPAPVVPPPLPPPPPPPPPLPPVHVDGTGGGMKKRMRR
ncbi:hypothetical protein JCM6882_008837 [Rhodosporidiobolus microsporus]